MKRFALTDRQPEQPKATVGLPMALHYYDQLPLWYTFFTDLGFAVKLSEESTRKTYYKGQSTIPSDTVCYPAKLAHGHIESLLEQNVDFIFYPCMTYNLDEGDSDNHYNCPVVAYYPELLLANNEKLNEQNFLHPFLDLNRRKHLITVLYACLSDYATKKEIAAALEHGFAALEQYRNQIAQTAQEIVRQARAAGKTILVLAGRPYHIDPEINHGIHKLISSLGMAVITEDSIAGLAHTPELQALNQWTYHSRMYRAAQYVTTQPDFQLVQLVSFGCGIDAITTDEVRRILEQSGKLYTQLKIDEISNLGAAKNRLRSLKAAIGADVPPKSTAAPSEVAPKNEKRTRVCITSMGCCRNSSRQMLPCLQAVCKEFVIYAISAIYPRNAENAYHLSAEYAAHSLSAVDLHLRSVRLPHGTTGILLPYGRRRGIEKRPQRYLLPGIACCWAIYGGSEKRQI